MSTWRREALTLLPECRQIVESADNPMAMWIELHMRFEDAIADEDWSLVARLLKFAEWCMSPRSGRLPNNTSTAAACAFYEHLPQNRSYWQFFPNWFSHQQFDKLLPVFAYHLGEVELSELKMDFAFNAKKRGI